MRTMMAGVLKRLGFTRVAQAEGVEEAIAMAGQDRPQLALVDLRLPDGTGEDVVRGLRADPSTADVAIVVMTADTDLELRTRLVAAGADTFVVKSEGIGAIRSAITDAAARRGLDLTS